MPPCLYDFGAGFTSDSSQWEDLESTDLDVCGVTMPQETCALRSRSRSTVAAPSDFSVNFLRLTGQRERSLNQRVATSGNLLSQDQKEELPSPQVPEHEGPQRFWLQSWFL